MNSMANGTIGYRINENNLSGILYIKNGKIYSIRYSDKYLYKDGKVKDSLSNYFLTPKEEVNAKSQAEIAIKKVLKSPSTAKFASYSEWEFSKNDGYIITKAYVDSQNSFGATVRNQFEVTTKDGSITSLKIDGEEYIK